MKKICSILLMMFSIICSGVILSSCSKGYKKMYLAVEYALPTGEGDAEWKEIDISKGLNYYLSDAIMNSDNSAYLLYLRVNVKGTNKKVKSLYVSQSGTTSAMLGDTESSSALKVTPNSAFKVSVHNIGSVNFNIKPSEGGDDKAVNFNINIWQQLNRVERNIDCLPGVVVGSHVDLNDVADLIKYYPLGETNQTGVDFEIDGVGKLTYEKFGQGADEQVVQTFTPSTDESLLEKVSLDNSTLSISSDYKLTDTNNVIKLTATSKYYEELVNVKKLIKEEDADKLITEIYVYVVENFDKDALIVSYNGGLSQDNIEDYPSGIGVQYKEVGKNVELYSSSVDSEYKSVDVYTYTAESIYSFISDPGMRLNVYIRDITEGGVNSNAPYVLYDYKNVVNYDIGLQISELDIEENSVNKLGVKLEAVKSGIYQVKLEVNFSAFDFSGSSINPANLLTREIVVNIKSLATGVQINGSAYFEKALAQQIVDINTKQNAVLYTYYDSKQLGLPLQINTHVEESINKNVAVSFHKSISWSGTTPTLGEAISDVQLLQAQNFNILPNEKGEYIVNNGGKTLYLNFINEPTGIHEVYMACKITTTPESFGGNKIDTKTKTIVIRIPVRGAVKGLYIKSEDSASNQNSLGTIFEKNLINTAYIGLNTLNPDIVDTSTIEVKSVSNNLQFSQDEINWKNSISLSQLTKTNSNNYKVYFKNVATNLNSIEDEIYIVTQNGVSKKSQVKFVEILNPENIKVEYDDTYTWTSSKSSKEYGYIALQTGKSVDFTILGNDSKSAIKNIHASSLNSLPAGTEIYNFSSSSVVVRNLNNNTFRVEANNIGYTAVVEVQIDFYVRERDEIKEDSITYFYEIAVYTPARDLEVFADKEEIVYINDYYQEVSKMKIWTTLNRATSKIYFSNAEIDEEIVTANNSIYAVKVQGSIFDYYGDGNVFGGDLDYNSNQNNFLPSNLTLNIQALGDLSELKGTYLYVDFIIYQFGSETAYSVHKDIYIGEHAKSNTIIVESDKLDKYSNIYLNLLREGNNVAEIVAYTNKDATYQELDYKLFKVGANYALTEYNESDLIINYNIEKDLFTINAQNVGGEYVLTIYTRDSYNNSLDDENVVKTSLKINVSDGSETNPYLINNLKDFKLIATHLDKHFKLSGSFDISALDQNINNDNDGWWYTYADTNGDGEKEQIIKASGLVFTGSLDGALTIYNPNSKEEIVEQYVLSGLRIAESNNIANDYYGLFAVNSGTIKNIVFDDVELDISIAIAKTNPTIGVVAGENAGSIINCSINLSGVSEIKVKNGARLSNLYVGLVSGINYGKIKFEGNNLGNYMLNCVNTGKLTISVDENLVDLASTNIYAGGIAGLNGKNVDKTGEISAEYEDSSSQALRTLLTGVVNIELNVKNSTTKPIDMGDIALGGAVGKNENEAKLTNVAITGKLLAYDKASMGGLVGINTAEITESANIGMVIEAGNNSTYEGDNAQITYFDGATVDEGKTALLLEQNVGGIVGYNESGVVDNVRVMFIQLESADVSVEYNRSYLAGLGNIGGIIGKASNTQLTRVYVENFIAFGEENEDKVYNIIGNNANIGGFIASNSGNSVKVGFVNTNIDASNSAMYEFGNGLTYEYVYFVGNILKGNNDTNKNTVEADKSYIFASYINGADINNITKFEINTTIVEGTEIDDLTTETELEFSNSVKGKVYWGQEASINNGLPYLAYKIGEKVIYTISVQPSKIVVNADDKYFDVNAETFKVDDQGIYILYTLGEDTSATAIVFLKESGNNTHKLVSDTTQYGLVEKVIIPSIASGVYTIKIIDGNDIVVIGDDTITFTGTGRVELEFISIYNKSVRDRVVLFVEEPLNTTNVVNIDIETSNSNVNTESITVGGETYKAVVYSTYKGANTILDIGLNPTTVNFENSYFDESKTYVKAEVLSLVDKDENAVANNEYFTLNALTTAITGIPGAYNLGKYEFKSKNLPQTVEFIKVTIKFGVYLNLNSFQITDDKQLNELVEGTNQLLGEKYVVITIHNTAKDLQVIPNNIVAQSGEDVDIKAVLTTGYVGNSNTSTQTVGKSGLIINAIRSNEMIVNIEGQDSIIMTLNAIAENELNEHINNLDSIWSLFKTPQITYKYNGSGYDFRINLELKDDYRAITSNCEFKLTVAAKTEPTKVKADVMITFVPQQLNTFRTEFYSELAVSTDAGNVTAEYIAGQTESALIIPGTSGLLKIFADKTYSKFDNIKISSSIVEIRGENYHIYFEQMVYDKQNNVYKSLRGTTAQDNQLELHRYTYSDGSYDGVIFVRAILGAVVGVRQNFTVTITADTYDIDGKVVEVSKTKELLTYYKPGVNISVSNTEQILDNNNTYAYLVEKNSSASTITANVFGYELNAIPTYTIKDGEGNDIGADKVMLSERGVSSVENGSINISYLLIVKDYGDPFKITFTMTLTQEGQKLTSNSQTLTFYPVDYIIDNFNLKGVANGELSLGVDTSRNIEFNFTTKTASDKSQDIYNKLTKDLKTDVTSGERKILDLIYINTYDNNFNIERKNFSSFVGSETSETTNSFKIIQNQDGTYRIKAMAKESVRVYIDVYYKYEYNTDKYELKFSATRDGEGWRLLHTEFNLNLYITTSEDAPEPIKDVEGLLGMVAGQNYILMNDITVENWTPITTEIASLDGNGYVINIKSFNVAVSGTSYVGLFASVGQDTIVKNVVVNVNQLNSALYINDDNVKNVQAYVGMLAGENKGLIYNCEVINVPSQDKTNNTSSQDKTINIITGETYKLTFGGLVGVNLGNITNSRVGTEYFEKIRVTDGNVSKVKLSTNEMNFNARGIMSGLVGINGSSDNKDTIISNCYVANTSIVNTSNIGDDSLNRTAGIVATNYGTVAYSYIKGTESSILTTRGRTTGAKLYASGSGSVAGFVFENLGIIHDSYSNIPCYTNSAVVSGFVYNNTASGSIKQSYTASSVNADNISLATRLPFVGIGLNKSNVQELLSYGELINCYYLEDKSSEYNLDYTLPNADTPLPTALTLEGFGYSSNLNNFAFINTDSRNHQLNGVWTYSSSIDSNKSTYGIGLLSLPEIVSANQVARSIRYLTHEERNENLNYEYTAANGYHQGSKNNPYIIRNVDEYDQVFNAIQDDGTVGKTSLVGYVRFIDNIKFKDENGNYESINTRSNYILGDKDNKEFTVIDGNGMTISGVSINYGDESVVSVGLFSKIYNTVIKSVNIGFENDVIGSTQAVFAGGVAGYAHNTYLININLNGANIEVGAKNLSGGVVGALTGADSGIANITTNLSTTAGYKGENSYKYELIKSFWTNTSNDLGISYSGGVAGIIDIGSSTNDYINVSKVTANNINVNGAYAGGIAGYLGSSVNASRMSYFVNSNTQVNGRFVAGGLVAENYGNIQLSQVGYEKDTQQELDRNIANYINSGEVQNLQASIYGNLTAVTGNGIVGGFVGRNIGGEISNSYTKASVLVGDSDAMKYVGGFAGQTNGGTFRSVYSQSHINIPQFTILNGEKIYTKNVYIGGLFGYLNYGENNSNVYIDNMVTATVFDKAQIANLTMNNDKTALANNIVIDYTAGLMANGLMVTRPGSNSNVKCDVYYGVFDEDTFKYIETDEGGNVTKSANKINVTGFGNSSVYDMNALYDLKHIKQKDIYETLFMDWESSYWDLDNTKFMPVLREDNTISLIELRTPEDVRKISGKLDGNYILMNDIDVSSLGPNHVVYGKFTGTIIGKQQEQVAGSDEPIYPSFTNITLPAKITDCSTAGFFQETDGARFTNIGFKYKQLILGEDNIKGEFTNVGGVSAEDSDSEFQNIIITKMPDGASISTKGESSVDNFGGMIGNATRSTIVGGHVDISLGDIDNAVTMADNSSSIGGVVGYINGQALEEDEDKENTFGGLISEVRFSGDIYAKAKGSNIGGIAGYINYTGIYNVKVVRLNNEAKLADTYINLNLSALGEGSNNIGGVVGYMTNSALSEVDGVTKVTLTGGATGSVRVGGMVGYTTGSLTMNETLQPLINDGYSELVVETPSADDLTVNVGGLVASADNKIILSNLVTKLTVGKRVDRTVSIEKGEHVGYLTVGGVVANCVSAEINSIMVYLEECYLTYAKRLIAGGVIGHISNAGEVNITDIAVVGQFFADDGLDTVTLDDKGNINKLAVMGGMLGAVATFTDKLIINTSVVNSTINIANSYTVLTLSGANVNGNDESNETGDFLQKTLYADAIVGLDKTFTGSDLSKVVCDNVKYSSDYTLQFSNYDNLTNYVANCMLSEGKLPIIDSVADNMKDYGWLNTNGTDYAESLKGTAFKPIVINNNNLNEISGDKYRYYIISEEMIVSSQISTLKGVVLGNNYNIIVDNQLISEITEHSAVANINLYVKYASEISTETAILARTNNGTIFMVGINYTAIKAVGNFAGVVVDNNGRMAYTYNVGYALINNTSSDCGGLAINNTGTISNSYYTGYMDNTKSTYGIVVNNKGYIENTYSAGSAKGVIKCDNTDKFGRLHNVYFDIYANFNDNSAWTQTDDSVDVPIWKTTAAMQTVGETLNENNIKLEGNWSLYTFANVDLTDLDGENNSITDNDMSYNYGYPVFKFTQHAKLAGRDITLPIKAKPTGNGEFREIAQNEVNNKRIEVADSGLPYYEMGDIIRYQENVQGGGETKDYIDNSFLISHLGVLERINSLVNVYKGEGEPVNLTKGKHFVLEYDIQMIDFDANSDDVMTLDNVNDKVKEFIGNNTDVQEKLTTFSGVNSFEGSLTSRTYPENAEDISNYGVTYNKVEISKVDDVEIVEILTVGVGEGDNYKVDQRIIKNLLGPVFKSISDGAAVANIIITSSASESSTLINEVSGDAVVDNIALTGKTFVGVAGLVNTINLETSTVFNNIIYSEEFELISNSAAVSGLFGENSGTVNIQKIETKGKIHSTGRTASGLVNNNEGTINILDGEIITNFEGYNESSISGLANINTGDIIGKEGTSVTSKINKENEDAEAEAIAGLVHCMNGGCIAGFKVKFTIDNAAAINVRADGSANVSTDVEFVTNLFGGAVALMSGGSIGEAQDKDGGAMGDSIGSKIDIELPTNTFKANIFGGVVARIYVPEQGGDEPQGESSAYLNQVSVSGDVQIDGTKSVSSSAYGYIVGQYDNNLTAIDVSISGQKLQVRNGINVGGLIGTASNLDFNFVSNKPANVIEVYGLENLGGFIGKITESGTMTMSGELWPVQNTSNADGGVNATAESGADSEGYAEINFYFDDNMKEQQVIASNFGGLFGCIEGENALELEIKAEDNGDGADGQNISAYFQNYNKVLNKIDANATGFSISMAFNTESASYVSNVGGIVGYTSVDIVRAVNYAEIGYNDEFINEETYTVNYDKMYNYINVGGIAGYVEDSKLSNCANTASVVGYGYVGGLVGYAENLTVNIISDEDGQEVTEIANIGQQTKFGESQKADSFALNVTAAGDPVSPEIEVEKAVVGYADVGGIVGHIEGEFVARSVEMDLPIIGIANVGGFVGYANTVNISNSRFTNAEGDVIITGNINVGGIAGYVRGGYIGKTVEDSDLSQPVEVRPQKTFTIDPSEEMYNIIIRGTVFEQQVAEAESGKDAEINHFIPTNIGGIVGYSKGNINFIDTKVYAKVETEENHPIGNTEESLTVTMVKNLIAHSTAQDDKQLIYPQSFYFNTQGGNKIISKKLHNRNVDYDTMTSGIGGFAGGLGGVSSFVNCYTFSSVYAPYGINVGGAIGYMKGLYVNVNEDTSNQLPQMATKQYTHTDAAASKKNYYYNNILYCEENGIDDANYKINEDNFTSISETSFVFNNPIQVAGKVFVGGYIGKVQDNINTTLFDLPGYIDVQSYIQVIENAYGGKNNLQKVMIGNCIGGVIGYAVGNVNQVRVGVDSTDDQGDIIPKTDDCPLRIFNSGDNTYVNSKYVGVIVGRIDGTMEGCYVAPSYCSATKNADTGLYEVVGSDMKEEINPACIEDGNIVIGEEKFAYTQEGTKYTATNGNETITVTETDNNNINVFEREMFECKLNGNIDKSKPSTVFKYTRDENSNIFIVKMYESHKSVEISKNIIMNKDEQKFDAILEYSEDSGDGCITIKDEQPYKFNKEDTGVNVSLESGEVNVTITNYTYQEQSGFLIINTYNFSGNTYYIYLFALIVNENFIIYGGDENSHKSESDFTYTIKGESLSDDSDIEINTKIPDKGIIQDYLTYNYGGLVGVATIKENSDCTIKGTHYYPFTINAVHNYNFDYGTTAYNYEQVDDKDLVTVIPHYVNQANITVSGSGLTDLYNNPDGDTNSNPLNPNAEGWHKDYTMFRNLSICSPQAEEEDEAVTGEYIQVLYDASHITEVYCDYSKNETTGDIVYTRYKTDDSTERLYSKFGIGTWNANDQKLTQTTGETTNYNREIQVNVLAKEIKDEDDAFGGGRPDFYQHVEKNIEAKSDIKKNRITNGYTFINIGEEQFRFTTVYGEYNRPDIDKNIWSTDYNHYPVSGSVFEVTGVPIDVEVNIKKLSWLDKFLNWLLDPKTLIKIGAEITALYLTGGLSKLGTGAIKAYQAAKVFHAAHKANKAYKTARILISIAGIIAANQLGTAITNTTYVYRHYDAINNMSMGLETSAYSRYINWDMDPATGKYQQTIEASKQTNMLVEAELVYGEPGSQGFEKVFVNLPYLAISSDTMLPSDIDESVPIDLQQLNMGADGFNLTKDGKSLELILVPKYAQQDGELYVYYEASIAGKKFYKGANPGGTKPEYIEHEGYYYAINQSSVGVVSDWLDKEDVFKQDYVTPIHIKRPVKHAVVNSFVSDDKLYYDYNKDGSLSESDKIVLSELKWNIVNEQQTWNALCVNQGTDYWWLPSTIYTGIDGDRLQSEQSQGGTVKTAYFELGEKTYSDWAEEKLASGEDILTALGNPKFTEQSGYTAITIRIGVTPDEVKCNGYTAQKNTDTLWLSPFSDSGSTFTSGLSDVKNGDNYFFKAHAESSGVSLERDYYLVQKNSDYKVFDGSVWFKQTETLSADSPMTVYADDGESKEITSLDDIEDYKTWYIQDPIVDGENIYANLNTHKIDGGDYNIGQVGYWFRKFEGNWLHRNNSENIHVDEKGYLYHNIFGKITLDNEYYANYNKWVHNYAVDKDGKVLNLKLYTNYRFEDYMLDKSKHDSLAESKNVYELLFDLNKGKDRVILAEEARVSISSMKGRYYTDIITEPKTNIGKVTCV